MPTVTLIADVHDTTAVATPRVRRALRSLPIVAGALDLVVIVATCVVALAAHSGIGFRETPSSVPSSGAFVGLVLVVVWLTSLTFVGAYQQDVFGAGSDEFKRVVRGSVATAALIGIACYLAKFDLSRGFFVLAFVIGVPALLGARIALRSAVRSARRRGGLQERVIISGTAQHVDEIATVLNRETYLGYRVIGALTDDDRRVTPGGLQVLGHVDDVHEAVRTLGPDVLFMADNSFGSSSRLREIVYDLESDDVTVLVAPGVADTTGRRVKIRPTGGLPVLHIEKPRTAQASRWAKRAFDIAGASALIFAFAPIFAFCAIRIWVHDRGPIFFSHSRVGKGGVRFGCLKFRTMVQNADELHAELVAQHGAEALMFKMKDDPRVTVPGRWMRKLSFDELPQLLNVLWGDMSLVGPRPQVDREVALYSGHMQRRLLVRPGMTGLWQVSGRSDLSIDEAMRLDVFYVDNWSMIQDLAILFRTWTAVFGSKGAY